jgi:hypothetical protein
MLDAFKQLVESGTLSEEHTTALESAFTQKIQENRDQVTAELREEFAGKYEHDKSLMVEAVDKLLSERLAAEMAELAEDKRALAEAKVAYQRKMANDAKVMESFVIKQLGKELGEFQSDRKKVAENFAKLEGFIVHALAKEIKEFAIDKQSVVETKVKLVREAKTRFEAIKKQFIQRSARVVEAAVTTKLTSEIKQLKEDIDSARTNNFGRRIFEAFAQEYSGSYLNEKSETSKLLKVIARKDAALAEAQTALSQKETIVESKERELRVAKDLMERRVVMGELLAPLGADKRKLMKDLLESVPTKKLNESFEKYLPAVMEGENKQVAKKTTLNESTAVTGDRKVEQLSEVGLDNILDIRKLAGLK